MDFKKIFLTKSSAYLLGVVVAAGALFAVPDTASALSFGPFTAYGGTIKATEDVIGLTHLVFVVKEKEDGSESLVVAAGTFAFGICNTGGSILGFGIEEGPYIYNILAGCSPIPAD
ncbi:MAG: hypothetical protein KGH56_01400 [Patescibacteria group bacterium]|nr:hypothetical protein [Patescibacteria group bacterium]